jgi:hypothetical protein
LQARALTFSVSLCLSLSRTHTHTLLPAALSTLNLSRGLI